MLLGEVVEHPAELIAVVQAVTRQSVSESTLTHIRLRAYVEHRLLLIVVKASDARLIALLV